MGTFDWVALVFASCVYSFQVCGELKDINLCSVAVSRAESLHFLWQIAITVMNEFRRWGFLTGLTVAVPLLVILQGSDALSICLNTVAIVFAWCART